MDDKTRVEEAFVEEKMADTPDLWDRINQAIDEHPEQDVNYFSQAVVPEKSEKRKFRWKKSYTIIAAAAACLIVVAVPVGTMLVTGLGAGKNYSYESSSSYAYDEPGTMNYAGSYEMAAVEEDYAAEAPAEEVAEAAAGHTVSDVSEDMANYGKKLIRTMSISMETMDFDASMKELTAKVEACGGYFENSNITRDNYGSRTRRGYFTIRIPADRLDEFKADSEHYGNILNVNESAQDVTVQYVDTTSHIEALEAERDKLLELMEKAENMEDILAIERSLTDIRYELNYYQSLKQSYDHQVSFATVNMDLTEVKLPTVAEPEGLGERMIHAFVDSLGNLVEGLQTFLVVFMAAIPLIVFIAVIVLVIVWIVRRIKRRKRKNK